MGTAFLPVVSSLVLCETKRFASTMKNVKRLLSIYHLTKDHYSWDSYMRSWIRMMRYAWSWILWVSGCCFTVEFGRKINCFAKSFHFVYSVFWRMGLGWIVQLATISTKKRNHITHKLIVNQSSIVWKYSISFLSQVDWTLRGHLINSLFSFLKRPSHDTPPDVLFILISVEYLKYIGKKKNDSKRHF